MRVFLKYRDFKDLEFVNDYPIHGMVFNITEKNPEEIRDAIIQLPFYVSIIGQLPLLPKYSLEEMIYFCKLNSIIVTEENYQEQLSCPTIAFSGSLLWNSLILKKNQLRTAYFELEEVFSRETYPQSIVLDRDNLPKYWSSLVKVWNI